MAATGAFDNRQFLHKRPQLNVNPYRINLLHTQLHTENVHALQTFVHVGTLNVQAGARTMPAGDFFSSLQGYTFKHTFCPFIYMAHIG